MTAPLRRWPFPAASATLIAVHPSAFLTALRVIAWLIALPWLVKLIECAIGLPRVPDLLAPEWDRSPSHNTSIAVIVPARNEAADIQACLESLLAQDCFNPSTPASPAFPIIAVDDRSTDSTGAIMDALASTHPTRLQVIHIADLPPNWLGKTHAMAHAARSAIAAFNPTFLLFTDADVLFSPTILRRALAYAEAVTPDHLVIFPTTLTHSPGESMLLSFLQVFGLFAVRPWLAHRPGPRDAVGVGAFNLIRTSAYQQIGGFDAIPLEIVEDLTLGRRVKAAGLHQRAAYARGAVSLHWAPGLLGILHGLTKNFFAIFRFRSSLLLASAVVVAALWIAPWILLTLHSTRGPAALAIASLAGMYLLVSRYSLLSPLWFITAPIAAALLIYSMLRSMLFTLRDGGVTWRGTFYPLAELNSAAARDKP